MILDKETMFSDDQAVTVTVVSTNIVDLGNDSAKVKALNSKGLIEAFCRVSGADFVDGTSITAALYTSDSSTMNGEAVALQGPAVLVADALVGKDLLDAKLPNIDKQYARITYTVVGTMTAGNVTAGLILDKQTA